MKPKYKVVKVNEFWMYHIYKSIMGIWIKIGGRDNINDCEGVIAANTPKPKFKRCTIQYYDADGLPITEPGGE